MFKLHDMLQNDCIYLSESELNLLLLFNDSLYPWFLLVPKRDKLRELFQLSEKEQSQFMKESSFLSESLYKLFSGDKMNIAALGNMCPQLHIHYIVRYKKDSAWPRPVWGVHKPVEYTNNEITSLKDKLRPVVSSIFKM